MERIMEDIELLQEYATQNSEPAFESLVSRHVNMVYSVALRQLGNPHHAEEVTQAVFVILAKKSRSLRKGTILSGWLYQTARLTARNFLRGEIRRQQREQEAYMQSLTNETESDVWPQIAPLLDDAMARLGEKDRNAIALRFFDGKSLQEVGADLGVSEDAAKMRVGRAVEKLRGFFSKRGVALSATLVSSVIAANSVQAAPAGLISSATIAATKGISLSASTLTLIKGTMKIMAWTKMKIGIAVGAAILLATGTTAVVLSKSATDSDTSPQEILQKAQETYASLTSYSATGKNVSEFSGGEMEIGGTGGGGRGGGGKFFPQGLSQTQTLSIKMARPNLYRIEWEQKITPAYTNLGAVWSSGDGDFYLLVGKVTKMRDRKTSFATAAGVSGAGTATVPSAFFNTGSENSLASFAAGTDVALEKDEVVNGVNCHVLSRTMPSPKNSGFVSDDEMRMTLWIGKSDHLIHQRRIVFKDFKVNLPNNSGSMAAKQMVSTETFEKIEVDKPMAKEDFVYNVPEK
jgi:RNA polymerase sigma factor (sigma-70 family)